jgi:hypothetical protein
LKKRILITLLFGLVGLFITGCSQKMEPAQTISWEDLNKPEYQQQYVAVDGYLKIPKSIMANDTMTLPLYKDAEDESQKVTLSVAVGDGNNQAELPPKDYKESDFKLRANDGTLVASNSRIKVSGRLVVSGETTLLMGPLVIEKP